MAKEKFFSAGWCAFLCILAFCVGLALGAGAYLYMGRPVSERIPSESDIEVHFLELGNAYTGDCTYIRAGDNDILIDAGSRTTSIPAIKEALDEYVTDGKLEYVIVTHAHQDHYAGFATNEGKDSLFDLYECGTIIDFAMTNQKDTAAMYKNYLRERQEAIDRGAKHYTAQDCIAEGLDKFDLGNGITMQILNSYFYTNESDTENNYSVCTLFSQGDDHYLFTGDLEKEGEERLVDLNDLPEVRLYKAGHHGSKTSSHGKLLERIKPEVVCVCCCCGSAEYTEVNANQFPTQDFIDRIAPYTDRVYVTSYCTDWVSKSFTSMNGRITVRVRGGEVEVTCSNNDIKLKDTAWFRENRTCPAAWAA